VEEDSDEFEAILMAALQDDDNGPALTRYAETAPAAMLALSRLDPIRTACAFGALLLEPGLQGSCLRLESLVHMALKAGRAARKKPTADALASLFSQVGKGVLGSSEAEAATLFVGLIRTRRGGFRVLEGSWAGASFNLQRVVDIVDSLPPDPLYKPIIDGVYALLKLSDLACERARLRRYTPGQFQVASRLSARFANSAMARRRHIRFSTVDLAAAEIDPSHLAPFVLEIEERADLLSRGWGGTPLERKPVLRDGDVHHLVLASSVSLAIRRFVIESFDGLGERALFVQALGNAHAKWFMGLNHFGSPRQRDVYFQPVSGGQVASVVRPVDVGRHLQFIFVMDDLEQIDVTGFETFSTRLDATADAVDRLIGAAHSQVSSSPEFRDGLTLVVPCGVGRPTSVMLQPTKRANWRVEMIGAADLETLSQLRSISPLSLWRLLDGRDRLFVQGARLYLPDGLLQLAGQARLGDGHLVDHGLFEDGAFSGGRFGIIQASPYAMLRTRQEAAENWDRQVLRDTNGRWREISRKGLPLFEEDFKAPTYIELEPPIRGVFVTERRSWWWRLENTSADRSAKYQRWQTLEAWMRRAAPILDAEFPTLGTGAIEWVATFDAELSAAQPDTSSIDFNEACAALSASADVARREVRTHATDQFERAFAVVDNIAERALVENLVLAVAQFAGVALQPDAIEALVNRIVPGTRARQTHAFRNPSFRDYVRGSLAGEVILISSEVDATLRIGLGWKAMGPDDPPNIESKEASLAFLKRLVMQIENDLIAEVRLLDRRQLVNLIVRNHELAAIDLDDFKRTAGAILAFHEDKEATLRALRLQEARLTIVSLTCRILLEVAVCEAPLAGGRLPGALDLERLMGLTSMIYHFGGDSDAVRWDVMRPFIRVTPLGDVHAYRDFESEIFEPYGQKNADLRFEDAVESYAENVEAAVFDHKPELGPDAALLAALEETLGAPAEAFGAFVGVVSTYAVEAGGAFLTMPRSRLVELGSNAGLDREVVERVIDALTFIDRPGWRTLPEGCPDADRQPWRFRRLLSVLRQPLVRLDSTDDPDLLIAPGLIRQAWDYTFRNLYRGDFHDRHLSKSMISWKARMADQRGKAFAQDVQERLKSAGWETALEVAMTKLLGTGFERNYGDVDVLAWRSDGRVLLIECKDVQYRKTFGEIAEQLADFRGEINERGKPDYLRRHLDRVDLARNHLAAIGKFVDIPGLVAVESHIVFRNPVPMKFALEKLKERVSVHTFADIATI